MRKLLALPQLLVLSGMIVLGGCSFGPGAEEFSPTELSEAEMTKYLAVIASDYYFPHTVEFRNVRAYNLDTRPGYQVLCVEARGRNVFGNMSDFRLIRANIEDGSVINSRFDRGFQRFREPPPC